MADPYHRGKRLLPQLSTVDQYLVVVTVSVGKEFVQQEWLVCVVRGEFYLSGYLSGLKCYTWEVDMGYLSEEATHVHSA